MLERKAPGRYVQVPGNSEEDLLFCAAEWGSASAFPCLIPRSGCVVSVLELRAAPIPVEEGKAENSKEQNPLLSSPLNSLSPSQPFQLPCACRQLTSLWELIPLIVLWDQLPPAAAPEFSLALPAGNTLKQAENHAPA